MFMLMPEMEVLFHSQQILECHLLSMEVMVAQEAPVHQVLPVQAEVQEHLVVQEPVVNREMLVVPVVPAHQAHQEQA
jgi:hypothetical protein